MRRLSAPVILAIGLAGLLLYAYPGYMSYDSVLQLLQARSGVYGGGHPPMMAVLWGITDRVIAGPFGMLLIQAVCFLGGSYLLLRRCMSDRAAAICASLLLWFPPVAAVMAVIWKDSQMAAYLVLGTALVLSPRRGVRLVGLGLLSLATAMRYNALAVTLPLVLLLFVWSPAHRWWQRYALALAAWFLVTVTASFVNARLVDDTEDLHLWHDSLALMDLTGTLRYAPELSDAALREDLAGTPLIAADSIQATARGTFPAESIPDKKRKSFGLGKYVRALWVTTHHVFAVPTTSAERAAIARAWKQLVLAHPVAYLHHRWRVFKERVHLGDKRIPSGAYIWFTDVSDPASSASKLGTPPLPSALQQRLQAAMLWFGTTSLFRPYVYLLLSLLLVAFSARHREILALVLSGIANEAALFVLAPTIDYRYSFWLVVATGLVVMMLVANRSRSGLEVIDVPRDVRQKELAA